MTVALQPLCIIQARTQSWFESPCIASFLEAVLGPLPLQAMVHRKRATVPNIGTQERIKKNKPWKFVQVAVAKQVRSGKA